MKWLPIDSAPKDGSYILLFTSHGIAECYWDYDRWEQTACYSTYDGWGGSVRVYGTPTHWMPSPVPPEEPEHPYLCECMDCIPFE